jgi:hypothetical protein
MFSPGILSWRQHHVSTPWHHWSITTAIARCWQGYDSGLFGAELDYRTDICPVKKGLTLRTFVTSSYKLKNMYYKTNVSILAKSLIISFQYNTESVYLFYSNLVYIFIYIYTHTHTQVWWRCVDRTKLMTLEVCVVHDGIMNNLSYWSEHNGVCHIILINYVTNWPQTKLQPRCLIISPFERKF